MAHRRVTVTFPSMTGVPADNVMNTFHFTTPTASSSPSTTAELESMRDAVKAFYETTYSVTAWGGVGSNSIRAFLSGVILSPLITIRIYRCETEISVGASAEPIISYTVTLSALNSSGAALPEEAAICLSFRGTTDPDYPAARQRGRVYIGPLAAGALVISGARTRVDNNLRATLAAAGSALRAWSTAGVDWVVWSHTGLQAFPVAAGWVDDAFDTQRRRGPKASTRTVW